MKKKLLALLLLGSAAVGAFAFAGCSDGGDDSGDKGGNDSEITDTDVPLDPSACQHGNATHEAAKPAGCTENGNSEYWYCGDCRKYFSDEAKTNEVTLADVTIIAAGHTYGTWIEEDGATCTEAGVKGHYHCGVCNTDFDAEKEVLTDLVIPAAGHTYGTWIDGDEATCTEAGVKGHYHCGVCNTDFDGEKEVLTDLVIPAGHNYVWNPEVPAQLCVNGTIGHYHCDGCGSDLDEDRNEILPPFGSLVILAQHDVKHVSFKAPTCEEDGTPEYWQCAECHTYFIDGMLSRPSDEGPMFTDEFNALGHDYAEEWTYDATAGQYKKVCSHDETHVLWHAVDGSAECPYIATDLPTFNEALTKEGGHIILEANIEATAPVVIQKDTVINLNKKNFNSTAADTFAVIGTATLTVNNGAVNNDTSRGFFLQNAGALTLNEVNIKTASHGVWSRGSGEVNINGGTINAGGNAVRLIPTVSKTNSEGKTETVDYVWDKNPPYRMTLNIKDTVVTTTANVGFWLVAADADFDNVNVTVNNSATASACVFTKGGTKATLTECKLTNRVGSGLMGNGSRNTDEDVELTLTDCTVIGGECALYLPQINSKTVVKGGTYTADATDPALTRSAIEIRGGKLTVDGATLICKRDNFKRLPNNNGSTVYGAALAVSQHTTNEVVDVTVTGCILQGIYALYEWDQDDKNSNLISIKVSGEDEEGKAIVESTYNGLVYSENCDNIVDTAGAEPDTAEAA